jgi:pyruvate formate lyase activating enzyme
MPRQQHLVAGYEATPEEIVVDAVRLGCRSIAYTYTEPTIFFEYSYDTARKASAAGLANIYVTNGFMTREMLEIFHPYLDAANIDLKAFRDRTYRRYVGARLQPVLDSLKTMKQMGIWLEVTTLVIPGLNDEEAELRDIAQFIAQELGSDTPWHISRFFPDYKLMDFPPTPLSTLNRAGEIGGEAGLKYIYIGNVLEEMRQNTVCPDCSQLLIRRHGFHVSLNLIEEGCCPNCGLRIAGIGMAGYSKTQNSKGKRQK